ncbi:MAG: hypothetical protein WCI96_14715, partial [Planctomycetota bacterium]
CGDAICSFNPIYGQGMTVAAMDALALRDSLRGGAADLRLRGIRSSTLIAAHALQQHRHRHDGGDANPNRDLAEAFT